jgi:hypothetical protein
MVSDLVQIQPATANLRQQVYGKLPAALTDPNRKLYRQAMRAVDAIEKGVREGDPKEVNRGHNIIRHTVRVMRKELCKAYRYPDPDPADPERWEVVCQSGKDGNFNQGRDRCVNCLMFDTNNMPGYYARQKPISQERIHESNV